MPRPVDKATIDALAANARLLLNNDHANYDGVVYKNDFDARMEARKRARESSPFQPGLIVYADIKGFDEPPQRVLVWRIEIEWSDRICEYVDHIVGFIEKKDGTWGVMPRHVKRGEITRGYEKARKLGLIPEDITT